MGFLDFFSGTGGFSSALGSSFLSAFLGAFVVPLAQFFESP